MKDGIHDLDSKLANILHKVLRLKGILFKWLKKKSLFIQTICQQKLIN